VPTNQAKKSSEQIAKYADLERWRKLCAEAAKEQDPQRLMELI